MRTLLFAFQLLSAQAIPGQIDRFCLKDGDCQFLAVQGGMVHFIFPALMNRDIVLGKFIPVGTNLLPSTEAAIRYSKTKSGWRVVTSAALDKGEPGANNFLRTRIFSSDNRSHGQFDSLASLADSFVGSPLGDGTEVVAVSSFEEHSYNVNTVIWLLPSQGEPKPLLDTVGSLGKFVSGNWGRTPGVWIERETYDGLNADTKGFVPQFWKWDKRRQSLELRGEAAKSPTFVTR